jgi:hypothetical protein
MRDRWYGDARDLAKWATLVHLTQDNQVGAILQVAFYRPDEEGCPALSEENERAVEFPSSVVLNHFPRKLDDIRRLGSQTHLQIEIFEDIFTRSREAYFEKLKDKITFLGRSRLIVFLDPDTGIEGSRPSLSHVRLSEAQRVFSWLTPSDWLVLYQHQQRYRGWVARNRQRFQQTLHAQTPPKIKTFSSNLAKDVVFFAAEKPSSSRPTP